MMFSAISYLPIERISIGPFDFSPHGVGIAAGFVLGAKLVAGDFEKRGISRDRLSVMLMWAAVGALVGARLAYVINHFGEYSGNPAEILKLWRGGISMLGGFFGAMIIAAPMMRREGWSFWKVMDAAAPGMALGVIVGRVGDLIVGDHLGTSTNFFLGYKCPTRAPFIDSFGPFDLTRQVASRCVADVVHQTALYDLGFTLITLTVLLILRRRRRFDGFMIMAFGAMYGVQRMIEDFLREDVRRLGLTGSQWTGLLAGLACAYGVFVLRRTPHFWNWGADGSASDDEEPAVTGAPSDAGDSPAPADADAGVPVSDAGADADAGDMAVVTSDPAAARADE